MRILGGALLAVLSASCVGTWRYTTDRVALAPTPSAPAGLSGALGVSPGLRRMLGTVESRSTGGAVAHPTYQPETGVALRMAEHLRVSVKFAGAVGKLTTSPDGIKEVPGGALAWETTGGLAYDVPFGRYGGVVLAGEGGVLVANIVEARESWQPFITGRAAVGPYLTLGPVRLYGAAVAGTDLWSEGSAVVTTTCSGAFSCTSQSDGITEYTPLISAGGGISWRVHRHVGVSGEVWFPLTEFAIRQPPTLAVSVNLGDLDFAPPPRRPEERAPAPEARRRASR